MLEGEVQLFEVCARMGAGRTEFRRFGGVHDAAAVAAAPFGGGFAHKDVAFLDFLGQLQEAALVEGFRHGDGAHDGGDFREAFLFRHLREGGIHFRVLVVFAGGGAHQIGIAVADDAGGEGGGDFRVATVQELEQALGMFLFLKGGFLKNGADKLVAVLLGAAGKEVVAVAGLGFAGKGGEQIDAGLGSVERLIL